MITLVIPSRNNLKYVKNAYEIIRKHYGDSVEIVLLDDASTDGTWEWLKSVESKVTKIYRNEGPERVGHTVLYDVGAEMASNEIFGIFHADMVITPHYIENLVKYITRGTVVCGTRIEPPLHPPGPEKEVHDLGFEPEDFKEDLFKYFVEREEKINAGRTTKGIFAPWIIYKEDFFKIGGHDKRVFSPMELEDSDLFNRFLLNGYNLIQSRDAFVYHFTCRGSRFKDGIKIIQEIPVGNNQVWKRSADSTEYTQLRQIKFREWWRKWHMDVLHDANMLPIVYPRYNVGFVIDNCPLQLLPILEPWCDTIYTDIPEDAINRYVSEEQKISKFNIRDRVKRISDAKTNDIIISFDGKRVGNNHLEFIKQLSLVIQDSAEVGEMEYDIFKFTINKVAPLQVNLINSDNDWYIKQLQQS